MTYHEPKDPTIGKARRHHDSAVRSSLSTTLRSPLKPVFDISRIEKVVDKYTLPYQNKFGTGPCGPIAQVILDDIQKGSLSGLLKDGDDIHNWRLAFTPYKGKHVHYVVVHIKNQKPDIIIDASNFFDSQVAKVRILTPADPRWKDYMGGNGYDEFEFFKDGEDITSINDLYTQSEINFWKKVW